MSFLVLPSSLWGRESWLLYFNCLPDVLGLLLKKEKERERVCNVLGHILLLSCKFIKKNNYLDFSLIKFRMYKIFFF